MKYFSQLSKSIEKKISLKMFPIEEGAKNSLIIFHSTNLSQFIKLNTPTLLRMMKTIGDTQIRNQDPD